MTHPTIFFSHSTRDRQPLEQLKRAFVAKTAGTIDVFLSSDGESIPLGSNWVATLQTRLETAALMLVFVTPDSIDSRWIHFEAGFSYAKGIAVVPVGFLGVDMRDLGPPLTLLQGFNVTGADSLNNLIALANRTFGLDHPLGFTDADYRAIVDVDHALLGGPLAHLLPCIERVLISDQIDVPTKDGEDAQESSNDQLEVVRPRFATALADAGIEFQDQVSRGFCSWRLHGMTIELHVEGRYLSLDIEVDPMALHRVLDPVHAILHAFRTDGLKGQSLAFRLVPDTVASHEELAITARLDAGAVALLPERGLRFRDLEFEIYPWANEGTGDEAEAKDRTSLIITPCSDRLELTDVADLLGMLCERRVIIPPAAVAARMHG
ncbi:MAG: toll/interleukin-1 receptor domain-containing protein [bacterium]|nr:toll/interleukin-1 receptor domain-containing protein [bacterium]